MRIQEADYESNQKLRTDELEVGVQQKRQFPSDEWPAWGLKLKGGPFKRPSRFMPSILGMDHEFSHCPEAISKAVQIVLGRPGTFSKMMIATELKGCIHVLSNVQQFGASRGLPITCQRMLMGLTASF